MFSTLKTSNTCFEWLENNKAESRAKWRLSQTLRIFLNLEISAPFYQIASVCQGKCQGRLYLEKLQAIATFRTERLKPTSVTPYLSGTFFTHPVEHNAIDRFGSEDYATK